MNYRWMPLKQVLTYEPEMKRLGVSVVARSPRGFLTAYKKAKSKSGTSEWWKKRRNGFVARHMAQYRINPTYRRKLALIAWAFNPD